MSIKARTILITFLLFSVTYAARPDNANWVTVNKSLPSLIYLENGEILSTEYSGQNTTTILIKANGVLYKWIEKTNGMNSKVSATECRMLLKPSESQ